MALIMSMLAGVPFAPQAFAAEGSDVTIYDLMTEDLVNPVGIDEPNPVFSWKMRSATVGQRQTAYQLTVKNGNTIVWDSGKVASDLSVGIPYAGATLTSSTEYTWTVTVWDKDGNAVTSDAATFETALLEEDAFADTHFISYQPATPNSPSVYTIDFDFEITRRVIGFVFGAQSDSEFLMWQFNSRTGMFKPHQNLSGITDHQVNICQTAENEDLRILQGEGTQDETADYANADIVYHARIAVDGKVIKTYLGTSAENMVLVDTYTHSSVVYLQRMGFRQASAESCMVDNLIVTDGEGKIYYENRFEDVNTNDISSTKAVLKDGWLEVQSGAQVVLQQTGTDITNYTIDWDFEIYGRAASLLFSGTDSNNFLMWQFNSREGSFKPHQRVGGTYKTLTSVKISQSTDSVYNILQGNGDKTSAADTANRGITYHARIQVTGATVKTWLGSSADNLTLISTYTYSSQIPLGKLGFRQGDGTEKAYYDNIVVTDSKGNVVYENRFDTAANNDLVGAAREIVDGRLYAYRTSSANEVSLQQELEEQAAPNEQSVPAYRKSITVKEGLVSAKLYTAGLGVYESYINGVRVGRKQNDGTVAYDELKPGFTQRNRRQFYSCFDVTWMLNAGENVLGGVVTDGWWLGVGKLFRGTERAYLAKLILTYSDGSQEIVNTDTTWKAEKYAAVQTGTGIYAGERYDASMDQSWMLPGYDDSAWGFVKINTEFQGELDAWDGVSVIVRNDLERTPQTMTVYNGATGAVTGESYGDITVVSTHADGESIALAKGQTLLVDFGQNFAGWEYFEIEGAKGTVVTVEHGEWLNEAGGSIARGNDGPGGSIYNANYRTATANTIYTMSGNGVEKYHPGFSFYGFQYIEITATADITVHKVRGQVVTSVHNDTATMETSDEDVNQLLSNIRWGMYSNYLSVPTDCPQRNERHGWTGDTQVFSQAGTYLTYSKSFLEKFLQDMRDGQMESDGIYTGSYSDIAPFVNNYGSTSFGEAGWSDAGIIVPWYLYMMYGDLAVLEEHWDSMVTYLDVYLASTGGDGPVMGAGDHLSPEKLDYSFRPCLGVIYYAWDALLMVDMANALGKTAEAQHYQQVYESQKKLFQDRYVLADGRINRPEQSAYLFALYLDLLPDEASVAAVTDQLVSSIESNGDLMMTGFLGTSIVMKTLTKIGRNDIAYTLLLQHNYPSWLYSVDQGANTIWERWNTYTAESGFGDVSMNSFNHYSYGAVAGWMYQTIAGIGYDMENPGFKNILLEPALDARLKQIKTSYESVYGLIETESNVNGGNWTYKATIPANTTATVKLPVDGKVLTVNGKAMSAVTLQTDGIVYTENTDGVAVFQAVAGSFTFASSDVVTQVDWSKPQYCQHCKKDVTWTAYTNAANLTSGHYYLANDITITDDLVNGIGAASSGKMSCMHLNGHTITCTTANRVFNVAKDRTLNIMDHPENQGVLIRNNSKGSRGGIFNITDTGVVNVYGGTMMLGEGCQGSYGALVYLNGTCTFTMNGGVLKNGVVSSSVTTKDGGSIYADGTAVATINGGLIQGGTAPSFGGNIYLKGDSTLIVNGGTITGGSASSGGNIYASGTAAVQIHGGSILYATAATAGGNIYMASGTTLTIDEDSAKTVIKGGTAGQGGNLYLAGATGTMDAGEVSFGYASAADNGGGNVRLASGASFTMNQDAGKESIIAYGKCAHYYYGGNVYVRDTGTVFTMNDGKVYRGYAVPVSVDFAIKSNSVGSNICNGSTVHINGGYVGESVRGASILTLSAGKTYINGGNIDGVQQDGTKVQPIRVWDSGKLYISGGTFTGGQVYADKSATIEVSGGTFTGDGIGITLNSASKGNATLKISGGQINKLLLGDNCDSYGINVTLSGKPVIGTLNQGEVLVPVTVSGLTQGASVTFTKATEGTVFGTGDSVNYIYSDNGLVPTLENTDLKWAQAKLAIVTNGAQTPCASLQIAIDNLTEGSYIKLLDNVTEDVTVNGNVYLDLNGKVLTGDVTGKGTLYGMDSATDGYTTETMGRITGTVSCQVQTHLKTNVTGAIRRYLAIKDDNGYTFHRIYLGITHMSLRPVNTGVGYKAVFCGDEQVLEQVTGYGYTLWVGENGKQVSAGKEEDFVSGKTVTLRLQNFNVEDYGSTPVYGKVYITLLDGTTIESAAYDYTLRELVEAVAQNLDSYSQPQLEALQRMLEKHAEATTDWDVDSIRNYQG